MFPSGVTNNVFISIRTAFLFILVWLLLFVAGAVVVAVAQYLAFAYFTVAVTAINRQKNGA